MLSLPHIVVYYVIVVSKMKIHSAVFWITDIVPCIDLMYSMCIHFTKGGLVWSCLS